MSLIKNFKKNKIQKDMIKLMLHQNIKCQHQNIKCQINLSILCPNCGNLPNMWVETPKENINLFFENNEDKSIFKIIIECPRCLRELRSKFSIDTQKSVKNILNYFISFNRAIREFLNLRKMCDSRLKRVPKCIFYFRDQSGTYYRYDEKLEKTKKYLIK